MAVENLNAAAAQSLQVSSCCSNIKECNCKPELQNGTETNGTTGTAAALDQVEVAEAEPPKFDELKEQTRQSLNLRKPRSLSESAVGSRSPTTELQFSTDLRSGPRCTTTTSTSTITTRDAEQRGDSPPLPDDGALPDETGDAELKLKSALQDQGKTDEMVQGNGNVLFARNNVASENVASYFTVPAINNNSMKVTLALGNGINSKCPAVFPRKENAFFKDFSCENRKTPPDSSNSDEDDDVEIIDDNEEEDWSFDEEEEAVKPGEQCPCAFRQPSVKESGVKTPLQQQDNKQDSPSTSRALPDSNLFIGASAVLPCPDCEHSFDCRVDLNRHRLKHITDKSFKCSRCDKSFAFSFNLKSHEREHTGEKPYVCNRCGLSFVHAFNFHEHQRVHDSLSHFVCSICLKWFNVKSKYLLHIRRHSSIKPFKCNMCGKAFHRAAGLRAHELLHSVDKEDQPCFPCQFCDRKFVRLAHKQMHEQVHRGGKAFPCRRCGNTFKELSHLKGHVCMLAAAQPFKCNICKELFLSQTLLDSHVKTHSSKKAASKNSQVLSTKFSMFQRKGALASAKRRFQCKLCSQTFSSKRHLEDHGKIHQREYTPYMCRECCLTFTHANYLKLHLTMHQEQETLKCELPPSQAGTESHQKMHANASTPHQGLLNGPNSSPTLQRSRQSSGERSPVAPIAASTPIRIKSEPL